MTTKSLGNGYKLTKDGKILKVPVFHSVSAKLKRRRKSNQIRLAKTRGERP